jgi:Leucine-rich repeat (LRR) protein
MTDTSLLDLGDDILGLILVDSGATFLTDPTVGGGRSEGEKEKAAAAVKHLRASLRLSCKALKVAFDACNAALDVNGGSDPITSSSSSSSSSSNHQPHAAVLAVVHATPCLASLTLQLPKKVTSVAHGGPPTTLSLPVLLAALRHPSSLRVFRWWGCGPIDTSSSIDLSPLSICTGLCDLLFNRTEILDLGTLVALGGSLEVLKLEGCDGVSNLGPISSLLRLQHLDLSSTSVSNLGPLLALTKLEGLRLRNCQHVTNLDALASCTWLKTLIMSSCSQITTLAPLASCTRLEALDMSHCSQIISLAPLAPAHA